MFTHKYAPVAVVVCLLAATIAFGTYSYSTLKYANNWGGPTTISVSGMAEVTAIPDIASFSFSVKAAGTDAVTAQSASAEAVNLIMTYLREVGIEERDIKTEYYNLFPKYRYDTTPCLTRFCPPVEPIEDGFEVTQSVRVKVRDTAKAGALITGVGERGATNVSGLTFTIDDPSILKAEARSKAIADAKEQAQKLSADLGVRLVRMTGFYEDESGSPMPFYGMGGDMMRAEAAVVPDIPKGEHTVASRVMLTFEIR